MIEKEQERTYAEEDENSKDDPVVIRPVITSALFLLSGVPGWDICYRVGRCELRHPSRRDPSDSLEEAWPVLGGSVGKG